MFGKNQVSKPDRQADGSLIVNSLFYTIQGEGPDAGRPAIFLRLAKCNLRCFFCDTEFEKGDRWSLEKLIQKITSIREEIGCKLLVITGGEPFLQNFIPLIADLSDRGFQTSIETAGTLMLEGVNRFFGASSGNNFRPDHIIICSPKTPSLNPELLPFIYAFKYIVRKGEISLEDGLPIMSTQKEGQTASIYRPKLMARLTKPIYIQPCDEQEDREATAFNERLAATIVMKHGYRLSMQLHKMVGLP